jgi:hypothetical protein
MESLEKVKGQFRKRFGYFCSHEVEDFCNIATNDYLMLKYPYDNLKELPKDDYYCFNWIYSRMIEIVENLGISSFVAYKENGVSMNKDNTYISNGLRTMLVPKCGTIKRG